MNDNQTSILPFPMQRHRDYEAMSDLELAHQAKQAWVRIVNMAATGGRPLSEEDKQSLRALNQLLEKGGISPLEFE